MKILNLISVIKMIVFKIKINNFMKKEIIKQKTFLEIKKNTFLKFIFSAQNDSVHMARLHGTTMFKVSIAITIWQDYMVPLCSKLV